MTHPLVAPAGQTGSISVTVPLLVLTVLVLVGFTFDGGNAITAHRRAVNLAEQAARAGAQRLVSPRCAPRASTASTGPPPAPPRPPT